MAILLNIIVMFFEVIYYSLFMKFARTEIKLWEYLLAFTIATLFNFVFAIFNINSVIIYLLFIIIALYSIKITSKSKLSIYDMFFMFIVMIVKIAIEGLSFLTIYNLFSKFAFTMIIDFLKIGFVILFKNKIKYYYDLLKGKWNNNNFYIRYIFNILLFMFIIMSFIFIIIK